MNQSFKMAGMACYTVLFEQIRNMIPKQAKSYSVQVSKMNLVHPPNHRIIKLKHSVCKVAGSCL